MELVEVELVRVVIHQKGDQQFIHLRERKGSRGFPIVIGFNEVEEINRKLCGVQPPRPLTHDLVGRILGALGHRLHRVVINELREATFAWLRTQRLAVFPFVAGVAGKGPDAVVIARSREDESSGTPRPNACSASATAPPAARSSRRSESQAEARFAASKRASSLSTTKASATALARRAALAGSAEVNVMFRT